MRLKISFLSLILNFCPTPSAFFVYDNYFSIPQLSSYFLIYSIVFHSHLYPYLFLNFLSFILSFSFSYCKIHFHQLPILLKSSQCLIFLDIFWQTFMIFCDSFPIYFYILVWFFPTRLVMSFIIIMFLISANRSLENSSLCPSFTFYIFQLYSKFYFLSILFLYSSSIYCIYSSF